MDKFVALLASGVAQGCIAALIALGIVLLHKATGIVNFAQGDLLTMGAYLAVWLVRDHGMPSVPAYAITLLVAFLVGVAIERVGYAPLRRHPILAVIISTFALALGLRSILILRLGTDLRSLPAPLGEHVVRVSGAALPLQNFLIVAVLIVLFVGLQLLMSRSSVGRQVRALAVDRETALLQGVRVTRLSMVMFGLSSVMAALGGILVAPTQPVGPTFGFTLLLGSFAAVVLGGFDNIGGTTIAAIGVMVAQQMLAGYFSPGYLEAYPYIILLVALIVRPDGLFKGAVSVRY